MAHAAGVQLDGAHACLFDGSGIHVRIDVCFHHADGEFVLERLNRALERGGFAGSGAGHQVQQEGFFALEVGAECVRELFVALEHALLDFVNFIHLLPPKKNFVILCLLHLLFAHNPICIWLNHISIQ
ncbi:hypothetical protein SDC9_157679 [bioreactor metagenome]|uniref:Uncharacterized protein n=1 Tax=bioreactor metagenome TaxID=1076179 RepID=A0A645FD17_9ZZZZ